MLETSGSGGATNVANAAEDEGESRQKRRCALTHHDSEVAGPGSRQTGKAHITRRFWRAEWNIIIFREEKSRVEESRAE